MDKFWVWLPRNSREYEQGATDFVNASARKLGNPPNMICPCVDCRNVSHQPVTTVLDHMVIRGMDQKYKRNSCWSIHGDIRNETDDVPSSSFEAYELLRTVFSDDGENTQSLNDKGDQHEDFESQEDASTDGTMRHPVDSLTWAQINDQWPQFAGEPRNLRLGLSTLTNGGTRSLKLHKLNCKGGVRCQLLDWFVREDVIVGEGEFCSAEPIMLL